MDATNQSLLLPQEIWGAIANFAIDGEDSLTNKIAAAANLRLVNTVFKESIDDQFQVLKNNHQNERRIALINKYTAYSHIYNQTGKDEMHVPSILYDALSTGCNLPYVFHSINYFDQQVEKDIKDIVKLMPCSLKWNFGSTRLDYRVSPLLIGCLNPNIPPSIIHFILEQGESPYQMRPGQGSCGFGKENTWTISQLGCTFQDPSTSERYRELFRIFEEFVGKDAPQYLKLEPSSEPQ